jgi:outer membrane protein OmpA-like peptidoglycan-associated protein
VGDQDKDGIFDNFDRCPLLPEDKDGFEDSDGCPDTDNDHDGIVDALDQCMMQPETINQHLDEDGCPDERPAPPADEHAEEGQLLEINERVFFKHNESELLSKSFPVLQKVASLLKRYPQIEELRVEGHTDDTGGKAFNQQLSQARAESVRAYMISLGVQPQRLVAKGFGDERPVASNDTSTGRALNRRVNFRITRGPQEIFVIEEPESTTAEAIAPPTQAKPKEPALPKSVSFDDEEPTDEDPTDEEEEEGEEDDEKTITPPQLKAPQLKAPQESAQSKPASKPAQPADVPERSQEEADSAPRGLYAVQVKASTRLVDAENASAELDKERFKNYTLSVETPRGVIHRVRLGPYRGRRAAKEALERYLERFPQERGAFVTRITKTEAKGAQR